MKYKTAKKVIASEPVVPQKEMKISDSAVSIMKRTPRQLKALADKLFAPYEPPKGVLPTKVTGKTLAKDAGFSYDSFGDLALLGNINGAFAEGYAWPGFTVLANWAQISEYRKPAEIYAREMTRCWIKFKAAGDEDKSEQIKLIEKEFKRLDVQAVFREAIEQAEKFGRSQIFIDVGMESDTLKPEELKTKLFESSDKVGLNSIKRLATIEPVWSYPNRYNASDPLDPTFYKPISWYVMGKEIHSSRMCTLVPHPVPDILKPAYAFAGLSLSQMMKPYVDNWIRTRQSVSDLVHSFTVWVLKTNMSTILNDGGAESFFNRLQIFNLGRDNHGCNAIDMETEEFSNVSASLGGLDNLQAQAQEGMCAPTGIPLVYLTGITPSGLNASNDSEIKIFKDTCAANQEIYTPHVSKILNLVMLSVLGEIDPDIGFEWEPLYTMSETELAAARKTEADTAIVYIDGGVVSPEEERTRIAQQDNSMYPGLDLSIKIEPPVDPSQDPDMMGGNEDDDDAEGNGGEKDKSNPKVPPKTAKDDWNEGAHPRGQPENAGEFASSSSGGKEVKSAAGKMPDGKGAAETVYLKIKPFLEETGLHVAMHKELSKGVLEKTHATYAVDLTEDNIISLKAFRGAIDSITGTKTLDRFREYLYKNAKIIACNFEPKNAIMATTKDEYGNAVFMVNMQVDVKQYIKSPSASKFNHSMRKGFAEFRKTGDIEKALAVTYRGTVQHELGHAFDSWCNDELSELVLKIAEEGGTDLADYLFHNVSEYSTKSPCECAAELFNMTVDGSVIPKKFKLIEKYIRGE